MASESKMEIHELGEVWNGEADDLIYSYTNVILRKGDTFFSSRTFIRLGSKSAINIDELEPIQIPIQDIQPPYSVDFTLAPIPLPVNSHVKYPSLLDCGTDSETRPSDLLLSEARICEILKKFPHPNIASYIGCITRDNRITALCFEKYNKTLTDRFNMDYPLTHDIDHGIKLGIQHLHSLGLSHNDINPHNIMFKSDGTPIIIDFDSCQIIGEKLLKGGGWNDQFYSVASPANDYAALEEIEKRIEKVIVKRKLLEEFVQGI
jgi:serine/threonine protein kinase